jgi:hypothetical protein
VGRSILFHIPSDVRTGLQARLERTGGVIDDAPFPGPIDHSDHLISCQSARLVDEWATANGLRHENQGKHSLPRAKAAMIYKAAGNLREIPNPVHTEIDNTVRCLGVVAPKLASMSSR